MTLSSTIVSIGTTNTTTDFDDDDHTINSELFPLNHPVVDNNRTNDGYLVMKPSTNETVGNESDNGEDEDEDDDDDDDDESSESSVYTTDDDDDHPPPASPSPFPQSQRQQHQQPPHPPPAPKDDDHQDVEGETDNNKSSWEFLELLSLHPPLHLSSSSPNTTNPVQCARDHLDRGTHYYSLQNYDKAMIEFQSSVELLELYVGNYHEETTKANLWVGIIYYIHHHDYWTALDFCRRSYIGQYYQPLSAELFGVTRNWIIRCWKELLSSVNPKYLTSTELIEVGRGGKGWSSIGHYYYLEQLKLCVQYQLQGDDYVRQGLYQSARDNYIKARTLEISSRRQVRRLSQNRTIFTTINMDSLSSFVTEADLLVKIGRCCVKVHDYEIGLWNFRQAIRIYNLGGGSNGRGSKIGASSSVSRTGSDAAPSSGCISYHRYTRETYQHVAYTLQLQGWNRPSIQSYITNSLSYGIAHETAGMVFKYQYLLQIRQDDVGRRQDCMNGCGVDSSTTTLGQALIELEQAIQIEEVSGGVGLTGLPLAYLCVQVAELYHVSSRQALPSLSSSSSSPSSSVAASTSYSSSLSSSSYSTNKRQYEHRRWRNEQCAQQIIQNGRYSLQSRGRKGGSHPETPSTTSTTATTTASTATATTAQTNTKQSRFDPHRNFITNHQRKTALHHSEMAIARYNQAFALYNAIYGSTHSETIRIGKLVEAINGCSETTTTSTTTASTTNTSTGCCGGEAEDDDEEDDEKNVEEEDQDNLDLASSWCSAYNDYNDEHCF